MNTFFGFPIISSESMPAGTAMLINPRNPSALLSAPLSDDTKAMLAISSGVPFTATYDDQRGVLTMTTAPCAITPHGICYDDRQR